MSKIKKFLLVMVIVITIAIGLLPILIVIAYSTPYHVKEENLKVHSFIDAYMNEYQEKVCVFMHNDKYGALYIRTRPYEDGWFHESRDTSEEILSGDFDRLAWYDDKIFIYSGDLFYVFDIDEYEVPEVGEEPQYELHEYTIFEMDELYPDFRDFDWEGWGD